MKIDADKIRELASHREGPSLDFKRDPYPVSRDGNIELAKDLIAMANLLSPAADPAYILIGVDEEYRGGPGKIVGIPSGIHPQDADLHQKVRSYLNRTPNFTYAPQDVDGYAIGVIEVRPGGRPFFAIREQGAQNLPRYGPLIRVGTSTDLASPQDVVSWAREDSVWQRFQERPEIEVRGGYARCMTRKDAEDDGVPTARYEYRMTVELFVIPTMDMPLTIPHHYCRASLAWPDGSTSDGLRAGFSKDGALNIVPLAFVPPFRGQTLVPSGPVHLNTGVVSLSSAAQLYLEVLAVTDHPPSETFTLHASIRPVRVDEPFSLSVTFRAASPTPGASDQWRAEVVNIEP
jgi:hypothetical protein